MNHVHLAGDPSDAYALGYALDEAGWFSRHVRGSRMRTWEGLFDEFTAAFQFPPHFGRNGNALIDCLTDLPHTGEGCPGVALVVSDAGELLADTPDPASFRADLAELLDLVARRWREPVAQGEWWDHPALPFVVVLQGGVPLWGEPVPDVPRPRDEILASLRCSGSGQRANTWASARGTEPVADPIHEGVARREMTADDVRTREDLALFLAELSTRVDTDAVDVQDDTIAQYVEAMSGFTGDLPGVMLHKGAGMPDQPTWALVAMIVESALSYE